MKLLTATQIRPCPAANQLGDQAEQAAGEGGVRIYLAGKMPGMEGL